MPNQQRYEGDSLEELLEKAKNELSADAVIVSANKIRTGGIAGFFAKERFEIVVEGAPAQRPRTAALTPTTLLDLAERVSDTERSRVNDSEPLHVGGSEQSPFAAVFNRITDEIRLDTGDPALDLTTEEAPQSDLLQREVVVDELAIDLYGRQATHTSEVLNDVVNNEVITMLTTLGLPKTLATASYVGSVSSDCDISTSLLTAMQRLPSPPRLPQFAGAILVAIGEREDALELGRVMATEAGLDPENVVLASSSYKGRAIPSERRINETSLARELGNRWRHQGETRVIAVETSMSAADTMWAFHVLGALQPSAIWAAVNAGHKNEDVIAWADRLGGIDALALTNVEDTVSPAALLQTGIPVARLDGRTATAALWTALLTEHIPI